VQHGLHRPVDGDFLVVAGPAQRAADLPVEGEVCIGRVPSEAQAQDLGVVHSLLWI
jgi:hypothetical protein